MIKTTGVVLLNGTVDWRRMANFQIGPVSSVAAMRPEGNQILSGSANEKRYVRTYNRAGKISPLSFSQILDEKIEEEKNRSK